MLFLIVFTEIIGQCDARTFCRPRECEDTINDYGISPFCTDIDVPDYCRRQKVFGLVINQCLKMERPW